MKSTIRIEYLQPTAVSAIDGSHIGMVTQLIWISPAWQVNFSFLVVKSRLPQMSKLILINQYTDERCRAVLKMRRR